ncbi:hypothetical protein SARC_13645, partial [Sphaeroforma arctica JP610]
IYSAAALWAYASVIVVTLTVAVLRGGLFVKRGGISSNPDHDYIYVPASKRALAYERCAFVAKLLTRPEEGSGNSSAGMDMMGKSVVAEKAREVDTTNKQADKYATASNASGHQYNVDGLIISPVSKETGSRVGRNLSLLDENAVEMVDLHSSDYTSTDDDDDTEGGGEREPFHKDLHIDRWHVSRHRSKPQHSNTHNSHGTYNTHNIHNIHGHTRTHAFAQVRPGSYGKRRETHTPGHVRYPMSPNSSLRLATPMGRYTSKDKLTQTYKDTHSALTRRVTHHPMPSKYLDEKHDNDTSEKDVSAFPARRRSSMVIAAYSGGSKLDTNISKYNGDSNYTKENKAGKGLFLPAPSTPQTSYDPVNQALNCVDALVYVDETGVSVLCGRALVRMYVSYRNIRKIVPYTRWVSLLSTMEYCVRIESWSDELPNWDLLLQSRSERNKLLDTIDLWQFVSRIGPEVYNTAGDDTASLQAEIASLGES